MLANSGDSVVVVVLRAAIASSDKRHARSLSTKQMGTAYASAKFVLVQASFSNRFRAYMCCRCVKSASVSCHVMALIASCMSPDVVGSNSSMLLIMLRQLDCMCVKVCARLFVGAVDWKDPTDIRADACAYILCGTQRTARAAR